MILPPTRHHRTCGVARRSVVRSRACPATVVATEPGSRFFVRTGDDVIIFPPLYGDDQTFCRTATEARTGIANLRTALRRVVVGRGARVCQPQSAEFFPRQQ